MRKKAALAAAAVLLVLTGCTTNPSGDSPAPTRSPSAAPVVPATSSPSPAPVSSPAPEQPESGSLTDTVLVDLCIEKTAGDHGGSPEFRREQATVEAIDADPPWLVIVPVTSPIGDAISYCTIGGTQAAPVFELHGAAAASMEAEVRTWAGAPAE